MRRIFYVTCVATCSVFFGTQVCAQEVASCADPLRSDSVLVATADAIVAAPEPLLRVWPGYWSAEQAFMLAVPGCAVLLVSSAVPPQPFVRLERKSLPSHLWNRLFLHAGDLPGLLASRGFFDLEFRLGEVTAPAVPLRDTLPETLEFLFHEGFHSYQNKHFPPARRNEHITSDSIFLDPRYNAFAEIERRILADALRQAPGPESRALLRAYLAVRHQRLSPLPPELQLLERELEVVEGSAQYVGSAMALLALEGSTEHLSGKIQELLSRPLPQTGDAYWRHRGRSYGTGAAIGLMLERLDQPWRSGLQNGTSFEELLARAVGYDPEREKPTVSEMLKRYQYEVLVKEFTPNS